LDPFSPKHLSNRHPINRNTTAFLEINLTALRNQTKLQITTTETFQISEPADRPQKHSPICPLSPAEAATITHRVVKSREGLAY
jgi:hypothetical protein